MNLTFPIKVAPEWLGPLQWGVSISVVVIGILIGALVSRGSYDALETFLGSVVKSLIAGVVTFFLFAAWSFFGWAPGFIDRSEAAAVFAEELEAEYGVTVSPDVLAPLLSNMSKHDGVEGAAARSAESAGVRWGDEAAEIDLAWFGDRWIVIDATVADSFEEMPVVAED